MGVGVILAEPRSGRIIFINKRCIALLGFSAEDVNARQLSLQDLIDHRDRDADAAEYARLLSGEICEYVLDKRYLRRNGDSVWLQVSVTLTRNEGGEAEFCIVTIGKMSERRIVAQQLAAARQLAGMTSWSWEVKSDLATTDRPIFGATGNRVSWLGKTLLNVHPDDRRAVESTIRRAVATATGYSHEYRVVRPDGEIRYMRGTATCLVDEDGAVTHLVGATIDVTDVKSRQGAEKAPKAIRDILKYIEKNWNKPIYLEEIARQHSISPRAIQRYFASRGMTPLTKYVKQLRLRQARQALSDPKPRTTVTAVALYCGFQNPGHFSRDYRQAFGELPSETLRNAWQALETAS